MVPICEFSNFLPFIAQNRQNLAKISQNWWISWPKNPSE